MNRLLQMAIALCALLMPYAALGQDAVDMDSLTIDEITNQPAGVYDKFFAEITWEHNGEPVGVIYASGNSSGEIFDDAHRQITDKISIAILRCAKGYGDVIYKEFTALVRSGGLFLSDYIAVMESQDENYVLNIRYIKGETSGHECVTDTAGQPRVLIKASVQSYSSFIKHYKDILKDEEKSIEFYDNAIRELKLM